MADVKDIRSVSRLALKPDDILAIQVKEGISMAEMQGLHNGLTKVLPNNFFLYSNDMNFTAIGPHDEKYAKAIIALKTILEEKDESDMTLVEELIRDDQTVYKDDELRLVAYKCLKDLGELND